MTKQALAGLRVLDFSDARTGAQVGQTLADFGAEVILIEKPGGAALRGQAAWPFWARGKKSATLDLKDPADLAVALDLVRTADVVIESFEPGTADRLGIGYAALSALNPRLVYGSITGFGRDTGFSDLPGFEGLVSAKFGINWTMEGMADRSGPVYCSVAYPSYAASQLLLQGILVALYEREESGAGQWVETSLAEAMTIYDPYGWAMRTAAIKFGGGEMKQLPRVLDGVPTGGLSFRLLIALTKDGHWLQFSQTPDRLFRAMMRLFGLEWMFDDPEWSEIPNFESAAKRLEFWEILLNIVRSKTAAEWAAGFDEEPDVWGEQFRKGSELLHHPQMEWNKMVVAPDHAGFGTVRQPGPIAHLSATPADVLSPPPALGQHDAEVRATAGAASSATAPAAPSAALPLAGVTIVELATFYAAPYGATLLGELGARVIKLEELNGEPQRNMLPFPEVAGLKALLGKESVGVDLATAEGREIAYRVIAKADIVLQSFRGGAAKRLGLDAESLRAVNPDLIYHNAPGYGVDGPYARRPAFAPTIGAAAGIAWRNAGPVIPSGADLDLAAIEPASNQLGSAVMTGGNADGMSAITVASAMMLGLLARRRGHGAQDLFTSMLSSVAHGLSEVMLEYDGQPATPEADSGLYGLHALYRLYETPSEWVFLAAPRDRDWDRLVTAFPAAASLANDPRFATAADRRANDAALAEAISALLQARPAAEWETLLRAHGVGCVVAARGPIEANYMGDAGAAMNLLTEGDHPILGEMSRLKPLIRFSRSATTTKDAPLVGQDTEVVLREFGYSDDELAALVAKGVIVMG
ncbi:CaiB/BaiF CoA transferase family protein [Sphingomonas immobilis]|uniref:CoA transferase n=1 Tax=Sphingomonas immobilis TaxID=3063997 RepID=A0ABT8ZXJ8_9SPHN|nr:CoA transferase [Sphingomonas sp. CA1-15]MDO7842291.1 CoA transferase [Sphingomonas sp. CA1-15]